MNTLLHLLITWAICTVSWPLLSRARWTWRAPRTAIALWQLLGATWLLCAAGVPLVTGLPELGAGFAVAVLAVVGFQWVTVLRARHRHRQILTLVARTDSAAPGALILDHPLTIAYCLPGLPSRVVLSTGTLRALTPDQLAAVLAHERAHARERHDLVLLPFAALRRVLPGGVFVARAAAAVELLVEMRADDYACRARHPGSLAGALRHFDATGLPAGVLGIGDTAVTARLARLTSAPAPLPATVHWLVVLTGLVLVSTPLSFLFV